MEAPSEPMILKFIPLFTYLRPKCVFNVFTEPTATTSPSASEPHLLCSNCPSILRLNSLID